MKILLFTTKNNKCLPKCYFNYRFALITLIILHIVILAFSYHFGKWSIIGLIYHSIYLIFFW